MLSKPTIIELSIIAVLAIIVTVLSGLLPNSISIGELIIYGAGLMFVQSLIRDLWIIKTMSKKQKPEDKIGRCMCLESTLGLVILIVGVFISIFSVGITVTIPSYFWPVYFLAICIFDFFIKDFIIEWTKFRIRKVPNHASLRF